MSIINKTGGMLAAMPRPGTSVLASPAVLLCALAIVLWAVFSVGVIAFSQWFPMDLPIIFGFGRNFESSLLKILSPYNNTGRFFPFYWIYYGAQSLLFGIDVAPYYFVQSILFLVTALFAATILYRITRSRGLAALLLVITYFSTPVAENLATLGKAEPLSCFLAISLLLAFSHTVIGGHRTTVARRVFLGVVFALAMWTKETSIVLFGLGLTGIVLSVFFGKLGRLPGYASLAREHLFFVLTLLAGFLVAKVPYVVFPDTDAGTYYTDYHITAKLIGKNFLFYVQQQPDVMFFALLATALLVAIGKRLFFAGRDPDRLQARVFVFIASLCSVAWAYYLGLLVWRWPMAYYMLFPAIAFRLCALYGIYMASRHALARKWMLRAIYAAIALCTLYAAFYIYYVSVSQVTYSRMYSEALQKYVDKRGRTSSLVIESYPFYSEQVSGTRELLRFGTGARYRVNGIADALDPEVTSNADIMELLQVTPAQIADNLKNLPARDDFLLVMTGSKLATWFLRGVTPYYSVDSILKTQGAYDMELVAERKLTFPAAYVHVWTEKPVEETTSIGYKLYRVIDNGPKFLWGGRYPDGWIGGSASLEVNPTFHRPVVIRLSAPPFTLPNRITISKDGHLLREFEITDANEKVLILSDTVGVPTRFQFAVRKTAVPKKLGLNKDARELGLRIALDTGG